MDVPISHNQDHMVHLNVQGGLAILEQRLEEGIEEGWAQENDLRQGLLVLHKDIVESLDSGVREAIEIEAMRDLLSTHEEGLPAKSEHCKLSIHCVRLHNSAN